MYMLTVFKYNVYIHIQRRANPVDYFWFLIYKSDFELVDLLKVTCTCTCSECDTLYVYM